MNSNGTPLELSHSGAFPNLQSLAIWFLKAPGCSSTVAVEPSPRAGGHRMIRDLYKI